MNFKIVSLKSLILNQPTITPVVLPMTILFYITAKVEVYMVTDEHKYMVRNTLISGICHIHH